MTSPKRILIAAIHYPVASGRYIARAFKRLGCDVRTIGPFTGLRIWGMEVDPRHAWMPDYRVVEDGSPRLFMTEWKPDLIVTADSAWTILYDPTVPHVVWGVDNHVRNYELGVKFDHYFLGHHDGPVLPADDGRGDMTWLPCAYDPEYFTPSPIPMSEREYDVCMVGVGYGRRIEIVNAMREAGLKVFAGTGLLYEDYRDAYHNSRISLCVSAAGDVAQRVFETAAMGCAILTDPCADFWRLGFEPFTHGMVYETTEEAVIMAQSMLHSPHVLSLFKHRAETWAECHTWDARAQVVLDTMFGGGNE